ncbi:polymorphic toxin-type HINT domain-containing protein [Kitasatospora sp. NPDC057500]|uniref:polymorphic toxin-type HINT domain-containing protein n=1 Tax=Kitasatospora sp. NPDC057500 TaxID=3346151 RepID=UPI00369C7BC7
MVALALTGVTVPPAVAWTYPEPEGQVWSPPNAPREGAAVSVEGSDAPPPDRTSADRASDWKPEVAPAVVTGSATVVIGADSAGAKAARSATGGASPASGGAGGAKAGDLAVRVAPGNGGGESAHTVNVQVTAPEAGKAAGVTGPLIAVSDADASAAAGDGRGAKVSLDLKALQAGGWSDRAALVTLPACALTTPERSECRTQTPVAAQADGPGSVSAEVTLPAATRSDQAQVGTGAGKALSLAEAGPLLATGSASPAGVPLVLTALPAPFGAGGNYKATSLSPSAGWNAGSNSGSFTYNYPVPVPPALGGVAPVVALNYNSAAVDGKTSATNSQSSWVGDGWGYEPGFIERSYKGCDKAGVTSSADLCWGGQNATLALGDRSGTIVRDDATGTWHLQDDDGSKIEQLTGAPRSGSDVSYQDMEYWRITTPDGTQYYFGLNHLPGGDGTDPAANSVLTTPVYSPKSGDPCYNAATGNGSWCQMAWRWQLDHVVDPHGNLTTYKYATEGNNYSRGGAPDSSKGALTAYQRSAHLREIGYGQRLDEQKAARGALNPASKVLFTVAERCLPSGAITCAEDQRTTANADFWPDVPIDQICAGSGTCTNYAPTFFTTKRLTSISTQVLVGGTYRTVDTWALSQSLAEPGDGTKKTLQLDSVRRTGSNGQTPVTLPPVTFTYRMVPNRVDGLVPPEHMFMRPRIQGITTEAGGRINVVYSDPECSRVNNRMPASEVDNSMACMPVKWYLPYQGMPGQDPVPVNDWFNKPLVKVVTEQDLVSTPAVGKTTEYTYNGGAAWHRNDAEFTDPKTRTWDQFRGYQSVTTTTGSGSSSEAPKTQQTTTYLRGMHGDYLANGTDKRNVQVTSPLGGTVTDEGWLAGRIVATENYDRAGGNLQSVSGQLYSGQQITATHAQTAGAPQIFARYSDSQVTAVSKAKLADGSWRTASATTTTDPAHGNRVVQVNDKGDGTAATPETCTTTSYATSDNPLLLSLVSEQIAVQGTCGTKPTAANTISGSRTLYDGKAFKLAGALGDPTSTQALDHFDQAGNPVYVHTSSATFDTYGRSTTNAAADGSAYDREGAQLSGPTVTPAITTVALTPATGALPSEVRTTGPMGAGWTTTLVQDPARGLPLTSTDMNGRVTTAQYDAIGRITAVWVPDRPTNALPSKTFAYSVKGTAGPSAITTKSINDDVATYQTTIEIVDGSGRPRQTQSMSTAYPTGRLITDTVYDTHGWVIKTSNPYYEKNSFPTESIFLPVGDGQIPGQTWNTYDGAGHLVRSEFRSNGNLQWASTMAYPGADRTDTTPPAGATPTSIVTDARGRTTAAWEYRTSAATGNPADADITTFAYTAGGQTAGRTDSSGNNWSYTYDLRGRQVSAADPDTGTSQTFYDAKSQIDHTVDAKGQVLAYTYDLLGRKTGSYSGSVTPANQLASWSYDTLAKGLPTSSTRYVGGAGGPAYTTAVTGYDTGYRALGTSITIPSAEGALAGTYTTTNTYSKGLGFLKTRSIPAAGGLPAETVSYGTTITGLLTSAASRGQAVIPRITYDPMARPLETTVGAYGSQVVSIRQYDWATGRVINSFVSRQTGTVATDQTSYTYMPSGRITSVSTIQDAASTDTQCFTYDHLGRLTNAWTDTQGVHSVPDWTDSSGAVHGTGSSTSVPGIGGCNNANGPAQVGPGGRSVGGPAPYWHTYSYDASGNRTGLVRHDISGNSLNDTTTTQTFGAAQTRNTPTSAPNTGGGTGGPHALLTSTTTGPGGTKAVSYQYDAKGNTTAITDTAGTTTLTWNGEDRLASLTKTAAGGTTSYLYDADGNQLIRRNPGKTTLNLPTDELTLDTATGSMSNTRTVASAGGLTYLRVTAPIGGGTVLIQAADPHGTSSLQINTTSGQPVTRRPTDPFGNPRGSQPPASSWAGSKGFVGGTKDDTTGLTNLGARQYDPTTGRFISPDPILDAGNPQQWNGYAYSENDPINRSDPSGLASPECGPLYNCSGSGNTITMKNKEETSEYVDSTTQHRYYETIKDDSQSVTHQWIRKQKLKNAGLSDETFGQFASRVKKKVKEISGLSSIEDCAKKKDSKSCASALEVVAGYATQSRWLDLAGRALFGTLTRKGTIPCQHSFPPDTLVLMADGSTKPIGEIQPGDKVSAADPQTGQTASKVVTDKIVTPDDSTFTELTLTADEADQNGSSTTTLVSTATHPYWNETAQRWTEAGSLQPGDQLSAVSDHPILVIATRTYAAQPQRADDLTVDDFHTYYVLAGNTPVLVHNSTCIQLGNNLAAAEAANPLIESLQQTGGLPSNYVTKAQAAAAGWKPGKALGNSIPGGQIGGDVFENTNGVVPPAPGRTWQEADLGLNPMMSRAKQPGWRLLYSNDGLAYVTSDHYETAYQLPNWR